MYAFSINKSSHCCAIYELAGLAPNTIDGGFIEAVKNKAKDNGHPHVLPLLIQFSDKDEDGHTFNGKVTAKGIQLYELLIKEGYKCDRFKLGLNKKSNNHVSLYHWWVHKNNKMSLVREYKYDEKRTSASSGVTGTAPRRGAKPPARRLSRGFLGLGRRTGT